MIDTITKAMLELAKDSMVEAMRSVCMTVSFVSWGFLVSMLIAEMFGAAFNPPILFAGMFLAWLASRKYT